MVNVRPLQLDCMPSTPKTGWELWNASSAGNTAVWWSVDLLHMFDVLVNVVRKIGVDRFCAAVRKNWEDDFGKEERMAGLPTHDTLRRGFGAAVAEYQVTFCE